eukprot:ANDGO_04373.mRNA.1 Phosphatidylinositol 3-kinase
MSFRLNLNGELSDAQTVGLPIRICDVPRSASLKIWLMRAGHDCLGLSEMPLYSKAAGRLRQGRRRARMHLMTVSSGHSYAYKIDAGQDPLQRLEKLDDAFQSRAESIKVSWLDRCHSDFLENAEDVVRMNEIDAWKKSIQSYRQFSSFSFRWPSTEHAPFFYGVFEFPRFSVPIMFSADPEIQRSVFSGSESSRVPADPQALNENPCEILHSKLGRVSLVEDKAAKPDPTALLSIQRILNLTCLDELSTEDKAILWKYRYYLRREGRALTKFLRCVDWKDPKDQKEGHALMNVWNPIEVSDALELLSSSFSDVPVRFHAVEVLRQASHTQICSILLQLVQALRYERNGAFSELANFLLDRACVSFDIACDLFWYLTVESGELFLEVKKRLISLVCSSGVPETSGNLKAMDLLTGEKRASILEKQQVFIALLQRTCKALEKEKNRIKKIETLKSLIVSGGDDQMFTTLFKTSIVSLPIHPHVAIQRLLADDAYVFKSAKNPLKLAFSPTNESAPIQRIIFKSGDDIRQDQLVMQMINLMDTVLKRNGLDLRLTPYRVLACSADCGVVECIEDVKSIAEIIAEFRGDIIKFLEKCNPQMPPSVMDNFVKSCAGYSVITFILGIGDRHLDNLLLMPDGRLFHIDFGFILGRDPKPYPPPMKLSKEIVQAMGNEYDRFRSLCCEAFNILRKQASLILNLLVLMIDANIPDVSGINVKKLDPREHLLKVQEKFRLDLSDEEAVVFLQSVINDSVNALFPQITEAIHRIAQQLRS